MIWETEKAFEIHIAAQGEDLSFSIGDLWQDIRETRPPKSGAYLVTVKFKDHYKRTQYAFWHEDEQRWNFVPEDWTVTAWMPWAEPYEEEEEE